MYYLALSLVFMCFGLLAYVVTTVLWPQTTVVNEQISFYEKSWQAAHADEKESELGAQGRLKRFSKGLASQLARYKGPVDWLRDGLEKSDLKIDSGEFLFYHLLATAGVGTVSYLASGWAAAFIMVVLAALAPIVMLGYLVGKRRKAFRAQLPETLTMLSGSLKAGYSLLQAVDMVAREATPPMSDEFKRVLSDSRLGLPVETALDKMAARVETSSFEWMVLAIRIQREVGGNLAEVLANLGATIRERESLKRQIKVLTAEGRLSASILLCLPFSIAALLYVLNPSYMGLLFTRSAGLAMIVIALALMGTGAFWLRKVVKIEV